MQVKTEHYLSDTIIELLLNLFHFHFFHSIIGITQEQFSDLFQKLSWKETSGGSSNFSLTPTQRLLVTMIWLCQYPSLNMLAWIFGVDPSTICRTISAVTQQMWKALGPKLQIPDLVERLSLCRKLGKYIIVMIVDGSEQQILESVVKRKSNITFSGKKKLHTFTKLIGVAPNGRIWFISKSYPGELSFIEN